VLQVLLDGDVRALNKRELTQSEKDQREFRTVNGTRTADDVREGIVVEGAKGEGWRTVSWIWLTVNTDENSTEMHDGMLDQYILYVTADPNSVPGYEALRIEWAKCKARPAHWQEEIMLLVEEMRWVVAFGHWKADWWDGPAGQRADMDSTLAEGLHGHAAEHAANERAFIVSIESKWGDIKDRANSVLVDLASDQLPEDQVQPLIDVIVELDTDEDDFSYNVSCSLAPSLFGPSNYFISLLIYSRYHTWVEGCWEYRNRATNFI
jgi:hypothetical protein